MRTVASSLCLVNSSRLIINEQYARSGWHSQVIAAALAPQDGRESAPHKGKCSKRLEKSTCDRCEQSAGEFGKLDERDNLLGVKYQRKKRNIKGRLDSSVGKALTV